MDTYHCELDGEVDGDVAIAEVFVVGTVGAADGDVEEPETDVVG